MSNEKVIFSKLSEADAQIVRNNREYQTFPSGDFFQGYKKPRILLSVGYVDCIYDATEDSGMCVGGTHKMKLALIQIFMSEGVDSLGNAFFKLTEACTKKHYKYETDWAPVYPDGSHGFIEAIKMLEKYKSQVVNVETT